MVDFPSVITRSVAVEIPANPGSALVFAPLRGVCAKDGIRLSPDSKFGFVTKISHRLKLVCKTPAPLGSTATVVSAVASKPKKTIAAGQKDNPCAKIYRFPDFIPRF